ncbi:MAG: GTP cyclohydrolase II [Bacteroidia bacterium]|nr:GTP cyclohydrolase II [Bacteroidia bacterium]
MNRVTETRLPTAWGDFNMIAYANEPMEMPHLALVAGTPDLSKPVLVRIHSECMTGDVFASARCDCGEQLHYAMSLAGKENGIVIYLRQEGRGIGLINKMKAYNLQDQGLDTAKANTCLGFEVDSRNFDLGIEILQGLGVKQIRLLTNNPEKVAVFDNGPIEVVERLPIIIPPQAENLSYLQTKQTVMGHLLDLNGHG